MSIRKVTQQFEEAVMPARLSRLMELITSHHRIQASPGYRELALKLVSFFSELDIDATVESFPADYGIRYLQSASFAEWTCRHATLDLMHPVETRLADYGENPVSLMQKSFPFPESEVEIVHLAAGSDEASCSGLDLRGRLLFIREDFTPYLDWAVRKRGALGFISDHTAEHAPFRTRESLKKTRKYTSFWWHDEPDITPFGFVITPEQGDMLAEACSETRRRFEDGVLLSPCPLARVSIDAAFSPGTLENVVATLPGTSGKEIWLIAHLCHPKPSANDNASGVAAGIEAICLINDLLRQKAVEPLRHSIRLLLVPEFTGTNAHLSAGQSWQHVIAALNLDMVGGDQHLGYGPLTLSGLSAASPSLSPVILKTVLTALQTDQSGFSDTTRVPSFNAAACGFTGGSDHFILQDPTIGIPCMMLGQWPDIYYHTDHDTLKIIDYRLLGKSAALASVFAYLYAAMPPDVSVLLPDQIALAYITEFLEKREQTETLCDEEILHVCRHFFDQALSELRAFVENPEILSSIHAETTRKINLITEALLIPEKSERRRAAADSRIPERRYRGPVYNLREYTGNSAEKNALADDYDTNHAKQLPDAHACQTLAQYHMNGENTIDRILTLVTYDVGEVDRQALTRYIEVLVDLGLCRFKTTERGGD